MQVFRDTFQRAVVVHATNFATVTNNVAHRAKGHNFFTVRADPDHSPRLLAPPCALAHICLAQSTSASHVSHMPNFGLRHHARPGRPLPPRSRAQEEGPERFALFENNLAVSALPHPILLGDDIEAAGFWLPGFTGWHRHNLAVGCPNGWKLSVQDGAGRRQTDLDFFNNSAHVCGFGWNLFPPHQPPTPNVFTTFIAFRCNTCML